MDRRATAKLNHTSALEPCILWQCFCRVELQGTCWQRHCRPAQQRGKDNGLSFTGGLTGLCVVYQVARVPLTRFCCHLGSASCHEFNVSQMKCARKKFEDVSDFFSAEVHHLHGSLCKMLANIGTYSHSTMQPPHSCPAHLRCKTQNYHHCASK